MHNLKDNILYNNCKKNIHPQHKYFLRIFHKKFLQSKNNLQVICLCKTVSQTLNTVDTNKTFQNKNKSIK